MSLSLDGWSGKSIASSTGSRELGLKSHISTGQERTIIGVIGDDRILHKLRWPVLRVCLILAPWNWSAGNSKKENTIIDVSTGQRSAINPITIMAGPCAVERLELTVGIAHEVKSPGATVLRGGAYRLERLPIRSRAWDGRAGLPGGGQRSRRASVVVRFWIPATSSCSSKNRHHSKSAPATCRTFELLKEVGACTTSRVC